VSEEQEGVEQWVSCNECGYEMDARLKDCTCEFCGAFDWSEPYDDDEVSK